MRNALGAAITDAVAGSAENHSPNRWAATFPRTGDRRHSCDLPAASCDRHTESRDQFSLDPNPSLRVPNNHQRPGRHSCVRVFVECESQFPNLASLDQTNEVAFDQLLRHVRERHVAFLFAPLWSMRWVDNRPLRHPTVRHRGEVAVCKRCIIPIRLRRAVSLSLA